LADIERAKAIVRDHDLHQEPEAGEAVARLEQAFLEKVSYQESPTELPTAAGAAREPGLVVVPPLTPAGGRPATAAEAADEVVFAVSRGMLYALAAGDGTFRWATRVGIDTTTLPVRLPASETAPEIALVLSSDSNTLTACHIHTGQERWHYDLGSPCLGRPVLVGRRALVPTYDGCVHEIEVVSGRLLGWYLVGLPLTVGGAYQDDAGLLYVPADRQYVFAFDLDKHQCTAILESGHPSGSLRSGPIVVSPEGDSPGRPNYLILNQTDGLGAMKLRAFSLPLEKGVTRKPPEKPELAVRGWSWFEPHCDSEKITLATDAGVFGLFGINQPRNQDTPLFPFLPESTAAAGRAPRRAQVAYAEANDFWVLMDDRLRHLQMAIDRDKGLQVSPRWELGGAPLGIPLHPGQVNDGRDRLFLVSQPTGRPGGLATAVDLETRRVVWQRRLGMMVQGQPLLLGGRVLTLDQEAGLSLFDPAEDQPAPGQEWKEGGQLLAGPVPDSGGTRSYLLPAPDGQSVYAIAAPDQGGKLVVRRYGVAGQLEEKTFPLPPGARLGGTPGVGPDYLVLPLADGGLMWRPWQGNDRVEGRWLMPRAGGGRGHVVHLGPGEFLTTDGGRGLTRWRWPAQDMLKEGQPPVALPGRIVSAPVLLPAGPGGTDRLLCVACAGGVVQLLRAADLQAVRTWNLDGEVTAGPYVAGDRIGCVVERRRLVWLDPTAETFWTYATPGEGIVGRPQLVGDVVMVADVSGGFVGLDPATGKPRGPGYTLKASVAPAAAPVAFGPDRAFVPMTDGTVLLLGLGHFRDKPAGKPGG
jgi:outer membrane protein assembly factor BamB